MSHEWLYIVCIWRKVCIASSSSLLCDWERVHVPFFCKALQNLFNPSTGKVPWLWVQTGSLGNRNRQNSPPILLYSVRCFDLCLYFWSQRNLRIQLTDAATEVAEIPQMFEYMEQTWFPFLWHSPNAAGRADFKSFSWFCRRAALSLSDFFSYHLNMGVTVAGIETSLLPSRQMTLLGGSLRLVNIDPWLMIPTDLLDPDAKMTLGYHRFSRITFHFCIASRLTKAQGDQQSWRGLRLRYWCHLLWSRPLSNRGGSFGPRALRAKTTKANRKWSQPQT